MKAETACFTGPRPEKLMLRWDESHPELLRIKNELFKTVIQLATLEGYRLFFTGMARGIDLIAAEAVLTAKKTITDIELAAAIPYRQQRLHQSVYWQRRYDSILQKCDQVLILQENYTPFCFAQRNRYMVNQSSHLIAVYNGLSEGGTASTIRYAKKQGLNCTLIQTFLRSEP